MQTIVHKYGGTSVADLERIRAVARRVAGVARGGSRVAVVVSAQAGETDRLIRLAHEMAREPHERDMDLLVATGEQASVALLSLALRGEGQETETFLGFQAGIFTDGNHGRARIEGIDPAGVRSALDRGAVAIVAGFQGIAPDGRITTIGRGGSDTSAVALAAALRADRCEIFTDVEGVATADPRICPDAKLLRRITYEEMMELADTGAKVLHTRCVELAARFKVPLVVRSSFTEGEGTWVVPEESVLEGTVVSGISLTTGEAKVAIRKVPDRVGVTAAIFKPIARAGIDVDLILQNVSEDGFTDLTFTVPKADLRRAMQLAEQAARDVKAGRVEAAGDIAKVSVVGLGMRSHAGVAHRMFEALAAEGIAIEMIGTSEIKVSIVVDIREAERAVRVLHKAFGLAISS
ncbi:MAG: aspartate kinase [Proteobacteria bacterium]|nr:aspartate kinase [Pseudomonadota bacterium]